MKYKYQWNTSGLRHINSTSPEFNDTIPIVSPWDEYFSLLREIVDLKKTLSKRNTELMSDIYPQYVNGIFFSFKFYVACHVLSQEQTLPVFNAIRSGIHLSEEDIEVLKQCNDIAMSKELYNYLNQHHTIMYILRWPQQLDYAIRDLFSYAEVAVERLSPPSTAFENYDYCRKFWEKYTTYVDKLRELKILPPKEDMFKILPPKEDMFKKENTECQHTTMK